MSERLNKLNKIIRKRKPAQVFALIESYRDETGELPRNKDLTERLPLTKGAVSNKCRELMEVKLVEKTEEQGYRINGGELRNRYWFHFRKYLRREGAVEPRKHEMELLNEIRTYTADQLSEFHLTIDRQIKQLLGDGLLEIQNRPEVETIRDAFLWTDQSIRSLARQAATQVLEGAELRDPEDKYGWLFLMAACMDHAFPDISSIIEDKHEEEFVSVDPVESDSILKAMDQIGLLEEVRDYDPATEEAEVSFP